MVAIDDIKAVQSTCAQSDPNVFRCDFEAGHNCSFTPVYNPMASSISWQVYRGTETTIRAKDHTLKTQLGHYYALDLSSLRKLEEKTSYSVNIESRYFRPTGQTCVTFSYYITGTVNRETLRLYIQDERSQQLHLFYPLWYIRGDLGPFWYSHRVTVNSTLRWQIGFNVDTNESDNGLIAIDDVIVELDKACTPKGRCDFEVCNSPS